MGLDTVTLGAAKGIIKKELQHISSAYDIAVKNGFQGTEQEWIESISGGESSSKRTCRFVIGTSQAGWTEKDCDYLCDGIDDQIEINQAIDNLPADGGEILILDGMYSITDSIVITKPCILNGIKNFTFLVWTNPQVDTMKYIIWIQSKSNICINNLSFYSTIISTTEDNRISAIGIDDSSNIEIKNNNFGLQSNIIALGSEIKCFNNHFKLLLSDYIGTYAIALMNYEEDSNLYSTIINNNTILNYNVGITTININKIIISNNIIIKQDYQDNEAPIYLQDNSSNNLIIGNMLIGNKSYLDEGTNNIFAYNKTGLPDENIDPFKYTDSIVGDINSILDNINGEVI